MIPCFLKFSFKVGIRISSVLNSPTLAAWHQIVALWFLDFVKNENLFLIVWNVSFFVNKRINAAGMTSSQRKKRNKLYLTNALHSVS
tara:strand:+ start:556 stop:816 length:261 start_codon:yes stop_codon:yes gene_type:complete